MDKKLAKRLQLWGTIIFLALIGFVIIPGLIVEWAWLDKLSFGAVFWKVRGTSILLFLGAFLVAFFFIHFNLKLLFKNIGPVYLNLGNSPLDTVGQIHLKAKQLKLVGRILAIIFGLFFAAAYYGKWDEWFRFIHAQPFGKTDPVFHLDIGFYMLKLPFIQSVQSTLIVLVFMTTLLLVVAYTLRGAIVLNKELFNTNRTSKALKHIGLNIGIWLLLLSFGYFLDRYNLLWSNAGAVFGAGYTDLKVRLPVLWLIAGLTFVLAIYAFIQASKERLGKLLKYGAILLVVGIVGQFFIPSAIQSMSVKPNELQLETPYLKNNIAFTRAAYGLDQFDETSYDAVDTFTYADVQNNMQTIDNIRLWDSRPILETYRQLQEIRLYYSFPSISINRYHTNRGYEQMMVAGREINSSKLPPKAQTWVNRHLQYTHGYGITMSPVAETNDDGNPVLLIKDLPPVSSINLKVDQPAIYYGERDNEYKLVNTQVKELDYPKGKDNVYTNYEGTGGLPIDNFFKRLLYSIYFGDYNLLFTNYLKPESKIQFWRSVQMRVKKAAPFLELNEDPYLVLDNGKLYWIQDAFLTSSNYPYSESFNGRQNYIRNSVKAVVDAYNGTVDFYITDTKDPLIKIYQNIFSKMFKSLDEIPGDLKNHIRYPEYLFLAQMQIYNTYHMTNPQTFYNNEDLWDRANSKYAGQTIKMESYYIVSKLPGQDQLQYLLISPLTPHNRDNMISWMAAESDFPNYGKVHVYELPKSRLFLGPAQIEAKIDQNTEISRQLSLWDQRGSSVIRGNLMIIPIEKSFIYVEPVFLIAQGVNIPQLKRVIATVGDKVVMEPSLHEAINALYDQQINTPFAGSQMTGGATVDSLMPTPVKILNDPRMKEVERSWNNLEQAMKAGDWEKFGKGMKEMDSLMR